MNKVNEIIIPEQFYNDVRNIEVAINLLRHVIEKVKSGLSPLITYKKLASKVGYGVTQRTIKIYLGNISNVCKENNFPYISGIVINAERQIPGVGYYEEFYGISKDDLDSQIKRFNEDYEKITECKYWDVLLHEIENRRHC